tara:strand:+ start:28 stop:150 length:123 start_codon:yes stop_codon:yes gene_type:complete
MFDYEESEEIELDYFGGVDAADDSWALGLEMDEEEGGEDE